MTRAAGLVAALCALASARGVDAAQSRPTEGALLVVGAEPGAPQALPLAHTAVSAHITGFVAQVRVQQTFNNPFSDPLEAVYVFPLPEDAAVGAMTIRVGDRVITGVIETRAGARRLYERARREGRTTARLDQERPNVFSQSVANIEPGAAVVVEFSYDVVLAYRDGAYEFVYPMVVGPRYIPGEPDGKPPTGGGWSPDTDRVPDASRITPPVRRPGSRSGHDVVIDVTLDPGLPIRELDSPTHRVVVGQGVAADAGRAPATRVALAPGDTIANRDFVLRYRVAGEKPAFAVIGQRDERGGHFALLAAPPLRVRAADLAPRELVFVVDTSASMSGEPLAMVKRAMRHALAELGPEDTFQIVRFSDRASSLSRRPLLATPENVRRGLSHVNGLAAGGGAEMIHGVRAALEAPVDGGRLRVVCLMTDGYAGNEDEILAEIDRLLGADTRLFSMGVGSSVNRYLLDRMAAAGRGAVQYVLPDEPPEEQVRAFYERVRAPVLTDIEIDWGGLDVVELAPARLPDLLSGQPLALVGRYGRGGEAEVIVRGTLGGSPAVFRVPVALPSAHGGNEAIARLWARARLRALLEPGRGRIAPETEAAATELALRYGLVSSVTSMVAVEERIVDEGGVLRTYQVPVEMPLGVSYEAVFGDDDDGELALDAAPGVATAEALQVSGRYAWQRAGRWRVGAGGGFGALALGGGDESRALGMVSLRIDGTVGHIPLAFGGQLAALLPGIDADRALVHVLAHLAVRSLLDGRVEVILGLGPSLARGAPSGLAYLGALAVELPVPGPVGAGLQLRYDGAVRLGADDLGSVTLGVELTW